MKTFKLYKPIKPILLLFLLLASSFITIAQPTYKGTIKGRLVDTLNQEPLIKAGISVINPKDSSVVLFSLSNNKGEFEINNIASGNYSLLIHFQDYQPVIKKFTVSTDVPLINFGTIYMEKKSVTLSEIIVEAPPVEVKNDTIEYRASSFKTRPNATAEDLLKKLPGVEVDREGVVKAQGEEVQKVYVDGKEFFGNDPKIATQNITADMIASIQVYNDKSEQSKFTRMDDGSRIKTINIKLKKDRQQGYFGRVLAGYGTDHRTQSALTFNQFTGESRLSLTGGYNNINQTLYNANTTGSFANYGGNAGAGGISISNTAGINYVNKIGDKLKISGSYFHSNVKSQYERTGSTQSFFPDDSMTIQRNHMASVNKTGSHRANVRLEYELDSNNSVVFTSSLYAHVSSSNMADSGTVRSITSVSDWIYNNSHTSNSMTGNGISMNHYVLYRRRFAKPGRTLSLSYSNAFNDNEGNTINISEITFYQSNGAIKNVQDQHVKNLSTSRGNNNAVTIAYTEPLGKKNLLEFNYSYNNNITSSDRKAYNYNAFTQKYDSLNQQLTNYFDNRFQASRYSIQFRMQTEKYGFQVGGAVQTSQLTNRSSRLMDTTIAGKDSTYLLQQKAVNFFPSVSYSYNFSRYKSFRLNYNGHTRQPSVWQLQQTPDISNPLQVRIGNPYLHQEFSNDFNIGYNTYNPVNFTFFNANVTFNATANKIVNSIDTLSRNIFNIVNDKSVQLIRPVNINGAFSGFSSVTLGVPFRKLKGSNYSFTNSVFFNRDVSEIYKIRNRINQITLSQNAALNVNFKEVVDIGLKAEVSYNKVSYSIQKDRNTHYVSQNYSASFNYYINSNFVFYTDFVYFGNTGLTPGYDASFSLWNASIAYQFLKKKNAELKLSVNDLLNEAKSVARTVGENYIYDSKSTVLQRYFMLTFTYNFNGNTGGHR